MTQPVFRAEPSAEYYFEEGCHILEHLNNDADPDASIARARVVPGTATRPHWLAGTTERYFILSGTGMVSVGEADPAPVGPGDVVLIPSGTVQCITNTGAEDLVFLAVCTPRFRPDNYRDGAPG